MSIDDIYSGSFSPSWIIVRKDDGKVIGEIFVKDILECLNHDKYKAVPILEYLKSLNKKD